MSPTEELLIYFMVENHLLQLLLDVLISQAYHWQNYAIHRSQETVVDIIQAKITKQGIKKMNSFLMPL